MRNYTINEVMIEDLQEVVDLVREVFLEFDAPDYPEEGNAHFLSGLNEENFKNDLLRQERKIWVCHSEGKIVGVIRVRPPCHINLLFVKKEHHGKGIARALFNEAEKYYKAAEISEITVCSSPYAIEAYRKLGFTETDSEQTVNGIRATPMRRTI